MPIECLISFDNNPQGVYYAGQELSGVVDLSVDATKRIKAIHITVNGYAKIRWIKKGYPRDSERAMCRAYRSYLSSRSYVLGSCANSSCMDWSAGDYSYTFHVILPENLPTSFDGKYGQIHYEIITTIDRPARYPKVFKLPFTVIQPLDLNVDTIYRVPLEILDRKRFWSFCCPTGPLTVKFSTPYCGYAPGQKIHFVLYINNESSIDITDCEVKLKQQVSYESHDPQHEYRYDKHLIARKQFGNVLRWSRKVYRGYLSLPSIPPSSVKIACPISIMYLIKVIIKPTDFHWKMKLKIPLTIGSIPIIDSMAAAAGLPSLLQTQYATSRGYYSGRRLQNIATMRQNAGEGEHGVADVEGGAENGGNLEVAGESEGGITTVPALLITDGDNPPDYKLMMPPSYEDAMALSDKFCDDSEYLQNVSLSSIVSNGTTDSFKPRYPVYYEYETPIIPPETLYDESPSQLRIELQPSDSSDASNQPLNAASFPLYRNEKK
ncbi:PREDICTED: arrestin domain-containing protein 17 [Rhagoletis zephyria]|uniref:arrestin domain-containing protein 17 n=1 Tax=Rhagoletis zephyria TaxID=28612 RepID=UPI0008113891|nr:PREDICTED: arrestin domain-containing protein 17 [Rhagoletis zephyria]